MSANTSITKYSGKKVKSDGWIETWTSSVWGVPCSVVHFTVLCVSSLMLSSPVSYLPPTPSYFDCCFSVCFSGSAVLTYLQMWSLTTEVSPSHTLDLKICTSFPFDMQENWSKHLAPGSKSQNLGSGWFVQILTTSIALSCTSVRATGIKSSAERLGNVLVITVQDWLVGDKGNPSRTQMAHLEV